MHRLSVYNSRGPFLHPFTCARAVAAPCLWPCLVGQRKQRRKTTRATPSQKHEEQTGKVNFDRDGKNVAASDVVVLIGIRDAQPLGLGGACRPVGAHDHVVQLVEREARRQRAAVDRRKVKLRRWRGFQSVNSMATWPPCRCPLSRLNLSSESFSGLCSFLSSAQSPQYSKARTRAGIRPRPASICNTSRA